jgi:trans-4-hydroxy-L-proline dehydratase
MDARIERLVNYAKQYDIMPTPVKVEYDAFDENLSEPIRNAKRLNEFLLAQKIEVLDDDRFIGKMRFAWNTVPGDLFGRNGHYKCNIACEKFYGKPVENLATFEWQHSNADFGKIIRIGLKGFIQEINAARKNYLGQREHLEFLAAMEMAARGLAARAEQYRAYCVAKAHEEGVSPERRNELLRMAQNCASVPVNPAKSFEEAIQCLYMCYVVLPDSIGRPDQYLYPLYKHDIDNGIITRDDAKLMLQELFIRLHGNTSHTPWADDKGAECHFAIGGYTIDHECAYNELSDLIIDAIMELPLQRPQVSLRWNLKTPRAVLHKFLDCERKDRYKRIAFVNDEPRIAAMMKICKKPWEIAYNYMMVGCNEPAYQGGVSLGGITTNVARSLTNCMKNRRAELLECKSFDEFYAIYEQELDKDLELMLDYHNQFNDLRAGDCNVISSLFLDGCIERAESATRGGAKLATMAFDMMGTTTVIDSLAIIHQFVFDEKRVSFRELLDALANDWKDAEELRQDILHHGRFFGNNDDYVDSIAHRFNHSLYEYLYDRTDMLGTPLICGNLTGYNAHFAWFGAKTDATPDGRVAGAPLTFGSGQSYGKDIDGATSQLLSVAKMDPDGIMQGNTIMNLTVDENTVTNDESFERLVVLVETYFKAGGLHLQLNHVAREDLIAAQANPEQYKSLRVRVSGFSTTFVTLDEQMQNNVIDRTTETV